MTQAQESEPPSRFRPPPFMVGQDHRGNWAVHDQRERAAAFLSVAMRPSVSCDPRTDLSLRP